MHLLRLSTLALAALTALAAPSSWASPVLGASSAATAGSDTATPTNTSSTGYAGSYSYISDPAGNGNANSFASQHGAYAVNSNAEGVGSGNAFASLLYTLTNNTGVAQLYSMSFHIYGGAIETYLNSGATLGSGESIRASYGASIKVGGNTLFSSEARIEKDDSTTTFEQTGTRLNDGGDDGTDGYYAWGSGDYIVELGLLGAGESIDILAEVAGSVFSNVGTYDYNGDNGYGYGYGYGCGGYGEIPTGIATFGSEVSNCFKGGSRAFYGDPFDIFGSATTGQGLNLVSFNSRSPNDVPEPASLPLVALALLGGWAATRRCRS